VGRRGKGGEEKGREGRVPQWGSLYLRRPTSKGTEGEGGWKGKGKVGVGKGKVREGRGSSPNWGDWICQ